ncbi:MAG: hypothetical protein ACI4WU_04955 [Bacilli bacterium]
MHDIYSYYITPEEYIIAQQNGISKKTLEKRIRDYLWPKEKAINTPIKSNNKYGNLVKIAEKNGINRSTFYTRINDLGYTPEEAATIPLNTREDSLKKAISKRRIYDKEIIELAKENGICWSTFRSRIKYGYTPEEAATMPVKKTFKRKRSLKTDQSK